MCIGKNAGAGPVAMAGAVAANIGGGIVGTCCGGGCWGNGC